MKHISFTAFGQGTIEAIITAPIIVAGVSLFFVLIYGSISSMIAHHCLYEMLICEQVVPRPENCRSRAETGISKALLVGSLVRVVDHESPHSSSAQAEIILPLDFHLVINESLQLPLQVGS